MVNNIIRFFLDNKLVTILLLVLLVGWGIITAPFNWNLEEIPRDPVPVDAIPNIGPNQQIVFTKWPGRSPQDIEDQITYPLTTALLGVPGVKSIRSSSMFGFSSIYIIFKEEVDFYWSRSRILEKLNSLPPGTLPEGVQPTLGPDATALGQIYWYTLEGKNPKTGETVGGWDPHRLRTIQDWYVRWSLMSAEGVSEVASIGGFVKEYQIDVDPMAMRTYDISLRQIVHTIKNANLDVGASTMEVNNVEYLVRGIGYVKNLKDLRQAVVAEHNNTPIRIKDVAVVNYGPAERRGVLDKEGAPAVGGVVVARYGKNPLQVIQNVKDKVKEIAPGLPSKQLDDGTTSKVSITPYYDRSKLIKETLGTLESALYHEILISILVVIVMVFSIRTSLVISGLLPIAVLMCFIGMKYTGITANIVALSGIAIAIGTMVDMAIVLTENILRHLQKASPDSNKKEIVYGATVEVASAIITTIAIIIISFLPVFTMQQTEGKLFRPLAFTKTFALLASIIVTIFIIPTFAQWLLPDPGQGRRIQKRFKQTKRWLNGGLILGGLLLTIFSISWAGIVIFAFGVSNLGRPFLPAQWKNYFRHLNIYIALVAITYLLAWEWMPLGPENGWFYNMLFVSVMIGALLLLFLGVIKYYRPILSACLRYKSAFLSLVGVIILWGMLAWFGFAALFGWVATGLNQGGWDVKQTKAWQAMARTFPGTAKEFMPSLDEGSFLLMPTTVPHAGIEETKQQLRSLDMATASIPEVKSVVGKLGRVESPLDPAPISMYENIINYKSEFKTDEDGHRIRFKVNEQGDFVRDAEGNLIPDPNGEYYRQWRDKIESTDDIWQEIVKKTESFPAITSAPKLQPIETRLVMLQTGMRAPLGVKVFGPDLETINQFSLKMEKVLKEVPGILPSTVFSDRLLGKPYLNIDINRQAIARYGLTVERVQRYIEIGIGGNKLTTTVEGRERFPVRVRFARDWRFSPEKLSQIPIPTPDGTQVPLGDLADINYENGPKMIRSEETFKVGYVTFGKEKKVSSVEVVNRARRVIQNKIDNGTLKVPKGVRYKFAGEYENQQRAAHRLSIVIPISLIIIFLILYFEFRSVLTSLMIYSSLVVALSGGFILIWCYGQEGFMNFTLLGNNMRDLFQMGTINLSVAVWVGFIALFGIAVEGSVVIGVYLKQIFQRRQPDTIKKVRQAVLRAGTIRIRPTLMTTATTILALLPVLSSTGKGANVMVPMAIPIFGGMIVQIITFFVVPVLYSMWRERTLPDKQELPEND